MWLQALSELPGLKMSIEILPSTIETPMTATYHSQGQKHLKINVLCLAVCLEFFDTILKYPTTNLPLSGP
jgi:hypothetical protein